MKRAKPQIKRYTEEEVLILLRRTVDAAGSQAIFADSHGISRQYLNDVLSGRRPVAHSIARALGLKRIVEFICE